MRKLRLDVFAGFETVALYYFRRAYELNKEDWMTNTDGSLDSKPHDVLGGGTESCVHTVGLLDLSITIILITIC